VGGATPQETPKALHELALGTITRAAHHAPRRRGGPARRPPAAARPPRLGHRENARLPALSRRSPRDIATLSRASSLSAWRCPVPGFVRLAGRWRQEPGRQVPADHLAGGIAVSQGLLSPWAHERSIPCAPQRRPQGGRAGQAGGLWPAPATTARDGVFSHAARAWRAAGCLAGSPRRDGAGGRAGRRSGRGQHACRARRWPAMPVGC
jgi:hypothetical protein